tara:strand:- start:97 stop:2043 length:1947 start_codon:yes stop_codon:yes gene_type:complete
MASEIRVNKITNRSGLSTATWNGDGIDVAGIATAHNFKTGTTNVHSTGVELANVNTGGATATFGGPLVGSTGSFSGNVTISGNLGVAGTVTYEDVSRVDATGISTFREGFKLGPLAGIALTAYKDGSIRSTGIITATKFIGDGSELTGAGPTLANGSNDRIVTSTGANALTGETNLTYSSSFLLKNTTASASNNTELVRLENTHSDGKMTVMGFRTNGLGSPQTKIYGGNDNSGAASQDGNSGAGKFKVTITNPSGTHQEVIYAENDANTASKFIRFSTDGNERLRIDSSGNSTFSGQVKVSSSNASTVAFSCGDTGTGFFNTGSNSIGYSANGAEKIRILNGGQMILGGTASTFGGTIPLLELQKSDNATGPKITMYNAASAQAGATCEIQVGHNYREAARVIFGRDNNSNWQASAAAAKSNIQFHTNNAGTVGEKVRVGAGDGSYFMIGTTNNRVTGSSFNYPILGIQHGMNGYNGIGINQIKPNLAGILFKGYQQSSGNYYANYFVDSNSQLCGYVKVHTNNQTVSYTNSSDYRLKQDDVPISDGITRVKQLRPIRFKWKSDLSETQDGFFAHEVQAVVPEAVIGEKDAVMDNQEKAGPNTIDANKILPQQLDTRYMVPLLTAALKEEIAKREALEARVAALESS